jgi:cytochrome c biogenesis protein CcmG, thiol:disulfide interchange protein DsbE
MRRTLFICLLTVFVLTSAFGADEKELTPSDIQQSLIELGFRVFKSPVEAPEFNLENLAGDSITLSSYRGKIVLLNFWATWCPPCRAEMPSMQALYDTLDGEEFEIVAVDLNESRQTVKSFVEENEYTFPVLLDSTGAVGATYGARSIPTSFLIDSAGNALGFLVGSRTWEGDDIEALFHALLKK